jgi:hypothetical protein
MVYRLSAIDYFATALFTAFLANSLCGAKKGVVSVFALLLRLELSGL